MTEYVTECKCGGNLRLHSAEVTFTGVRICPDGFDLFEAKTIHTDSEVVVCLECGWTGKLRMKRDE